MPNFKKDYDHWQANRDRFKGIHPDHDKQKWEVSVMMHGKKLGMHVNSLRLAKQAVNTFRNEGKANG